MRRTAPSHLPPVLQLCCAASIGAFLIAATMLGSRAGIDALVGVDDAATCAQASGEPAIAACTRAITSGRYVGHELARLHSNRAFEYANKDDNDRAIAGYDVAIQIDPTEALFYNNRGFSWRVKGEYDLAIADYDEAIRLDPNDADYYNNRGTSWHLKGDDDRAIADYSAAIRLDPKGQIASVPAGLLME